MTVISDADVAVTDSVLRSRRLDWIRALESGEYRQTPGALFEQTVNYGTDARGYQFAEDVIPNTQRFCCLGVARDVPTLGNWSHFITDDSADASTDYAWVTEFYGLSGELKSYLMAMNDGDSAHSATERETYTGSAKMLRTGHAGSRDFAFIARFLRKLWQMEEA